MAFSQLTILVSTGGTTAAVNVVIGLPPGAVSDPFNDPAKGPNAQSQPGVAGIVNGIKQNGFWDAAGASFYPPSAILKVTPG